MQNFETKLSSFLSQFDEDEQSRILQYAIDHIVPRLKSQKDDMNDAIRFRKLMNLGRCDSKHSGLCVGDSTKAKLAFRFWCSADDAIALIDQLD